MIPSWLIDWYLFLSSCVYNKIHSDCSAFFVLIFIGTVKSILVKFVLSEDWTVREVRLEPVHRGGWTDAL